MNLAALHGGHHCAIRLVQVRTTRIAAIARQRGNFGIITLQLFRHNIPQGKRSQAGRIGHIATHLEFEQFRHNSGVATFAHSPAEFSDLQAQARLELIVGKALEDLLK